MTRKRRGPTAQDVAKAAGVAPATAARALSNYSSVSPAVRERVLRAAASLGYRPNRLARSMATGLTQSIGAVVANIEDEFFARIVRGIADEARRAGYEVLLGNSDEDVEEERAVVRVLAEKQVDGLIVTPAAVHDYRHLKEFADCGMPVVLLDRNIPELGTDAVVIDGLHAAAAATAHLIELGHRRIAIVTDVPEGTELPVDFAPPKHIATAGGRLSGYMRALKRAGVPSTEDLIRRAEPTVDGAREETLALLDSGARPSAIFTTDNTMTLGTLEALQEREIDIPAEISLLGFDDLEWTKVVSPPLSVVSQPIYELGATAACTLLARLAGWDGPPETRTLPTNLLQRGSISRHQDPARPPSASPRHPPD